MKKYKCDICEDTGFKDFASFCMDSCDHDTKQVLQSALDTQKPAGDAVARIDARFDADGLNCGDVKQFAADWQTVKAALNGDCGGGDKEKRIPVVERRLISETLEDWRFTNGEYSFQFKQGVEWGISKAIRDEEHGIKKYMLDEALTADNAKRGE